MEDASKLFISLCKQLAHEEKEATERGRTEI